MFLEWPQHSDALQVAHERGQAGVVWFVYGPNGSRHQVESKPVLDGSHNTWQPAFKVEIPSTNLWQKIHLTPADRTMFFRVRRQ